MFKVLLRLYLVTMVTFGAAIYLVPELIVTVFHERFMHYNVDMSRLFLYLNLIHFFRQLLNYNIMLCLIFK